MISVLVCDDQMLVRAGLRTILDAQEGIRVVGEAVDGRDAVARVRELRPDVVLMDIRMPVCDGIEATRVLRNDPAPRPSVVMLTTFDADDLLHDALGAGASGFLLKSAPAEELGRAVRRAAEGDLLLAPEIIRRIVSHYLERAGRPAPIEGFELLTEREREVLAHIGRGASNGEIAAGLFVSEATVKTHVNRIFAKLGVRDRAQAVVIAYEAGLVRPSG